MPVKDEASKPVSNDVIRHHGLADTGAIDPAGCRRGRNEEHVIGVVKEQQLVLQILPSEPRL